MKTGRVLKLDPQGFGWINTEDGSLFFHFSAVKNVRFQQLEVGQLVQYEEGRSHLGHRAEIVEVVEEPAGRPNSNEDELARIFRSVESGEPIDVDLLHDVNATNSVGETLLHVACRDRRSGVVLALLQRGANPNVRTAADGDTPLHTATRLGDEAIVETLIDGGADVVVGNDVGDTPLHLAASGDRFEVAVRLFDAGADPYSPNSAGRSAIDLATGALRTMLETRET